jgi:hypothetical protein
MKVQVAATTTTTTTAKTPQQEDGGIEKSRASEGEAPLSRHRHHRPHRQWLIDRTLGNSQVSENGEEEARRPPLSCCWAPVCVGHCPRVFEQNLCCEAMGSIGFQKALGENRVRRRRIMTVSAICNATGFILTLLSCLAMSTNYNTLTAFSFTNGHIQSTTTTMTTEQSENNNNLEEEFRPMTMALGLRAVATENLRSFRYNETGTAVYTFDEFCNLAEQANNRSETTTTTTTSYFPTDDKCHSCRDVSSTLMISLGVSLLAYIPSMSTSFSRMYYNYDVNCRKTLAIFTTALSFLMAFKTIRGYKDNCYSAFYDVQIPLDMQHKTFVTASSQLENGAADEDEEIVTVALEWNAGLGFLCLLVAMALKILELTLHLILPSPSIARNRHEQAAYESKRQNQSKSTLNDDGDEENAVKTPEKDPSATYGTMARGDAEKYANEEQEPSDLVIGAASERPPAESGP